MHITKRGRTCINKQSKGIVEGKTLVSPKVQAVGAIKGITWERYKFREERCTEIIMFHTQMNVRDAWFFIT